jgi:hypothetical protein
MRWSFPHWFIDRGHRWQYYCCSREKWFKRRHCWCTPWEDSAERESDIYLRSVSLLFPLITARQIGKRIEEMSPKLNVYMRKRKNLFPFFLGQQRKRRHCLYLKRKDHPICFNDVARRGVFVTDIVLACNQANARGILWNIHIPPTV